MSMIVEYCCLNERWYWFEFCGERRKRELSRCETDQERACRESSCMMCSLTDFLKFTGEEVGMFRGKLPTLDTELWVVENKRVEFEFYEKPKCGNRLLLRDTALPPRSSME